MKVNSGLNSLIALSLLVNIGNAFMQTTKTFITEFQTAQKPQLIQIHMLPSFVLSDEKVVESVSKAAPKAAAVVEAVDPSLASQVTSGLQNIAVGVVAVLFLIAGLTVLTATVLVPKAAEQLEEETRALRPELWEEFQRRLAPGETLVQRPDLLQELGNIMQPIIIANAERRADEEARAQMGSPNPQSTPQSAPRYDSPSRSYDNPEMDSLRQQFDSSSMSSWDSDVGDEDRNRY